MNETSARNLLLDFLDMERREIAKRQRIMGPWQFMYEDRSAAPQRTGRHSEWRDLLGLRLIDEVAEIKAGGAKTTAEAIRMLREKKSPREWRNYQQRYLEKCHAIAKKFWQPYIDRHRAAHPNYY
jgi:hypothetical protein